MEKILNAFVGAALRASRIGFDVVELHAAHGYLLHEFLSPVANQRTDSYGGSLKNRMRFPLAVAKAVRAALPENVTLGVRITGTDWVDAGWTPADAVTFARQLKSLDVAYVCVSSGGITHPLQVPALPGYNVPFAERVKKETEIAVQTVGMILEPKQAEGIITSGQVDMVCMARAFLDNPRWVWHAAEALGGDAYYPRQYERARRSAWPGAALIRPLKSE
jgi:2,4-dienoyl-CoA reductase-like NADH-dependent reductase (Old Yellow Enzyme family)